MAFQDPVVPPPPQTATQLTPEEALAKLKMVQIRQRSPQQDALAAKKQALEGMARYQPEPSLGQKIVHTGLGVAMPVVGGLGAGALGLTGGPLAIATGMAGAAAGGGLADAYRQMDLIDAWTQHRDQEVAKWNKTNPANQITAEEIPKPPEIDKLQLALSSAVSAMPMPARQALIEAMAARGFATTGLKGVAARTLASAPGSAIIGAGTNIAQQVGQARQQLGETGEFKLDPYGALEGAASGLVMSPLAGIFPGQAKGGTAPRSSEGLGTPHFVKNRTIPDDPLTAHADALKSAIATPEGLAAHVHAFGDEMGTGRDAGRIFGQLVSHPDKGATLAWFDSLQPSTPRGRAALGILRDHIDAQQGLTSKGQVQQAEAQLAALDEAIAADPTNVDLQRQKITAQQRSKSLREALEVEAQDQAREASHVPSRTPFQQITKDLSGDDWSAGVDAKIEALKGQKQRALAEAQVAVLNAQNAGLTAQTAGLRNFIDNKVITELQQTGALSQTTKNSLGRLTARLNQAALAAAKTAKAGAKQAAAQQTPVTQPAPQVAPQTQPPVKRGATGPIKGPTAASTRPAFAAEVKTRAARAGLTPDELDALLKETYEGDVGVPAPPPKKQPAASQQALGAGMASTQQLTNAFSRGQSKVPKKQAVAGARAIEQARAQAEARKARVVPPTPAPLPSEAVTPTQAKRVRTKKVAPVEEPIQVPTKAVASKPVAGVRTSKFKSLLSKLEGGEEGFIDIGKMFGKQEAAPDRPGGAGPAPKKAKNRYAGAFDEIRNPTVLQAIVKRNASNTEMVAAAQDRLAALSGGAAGPGLAKAVTGFQGKAAPTAPRSATPVRTDPIEPAVQAKQVLARSRVDALKHINSLSDDLDLRDLDAEIAKLKPQSDLRAAIATRRQRLSGLKAEAEAPKKEYPKHPAPTPKPGGKKYLFTGSEGYANREAVERAVRELPEGSTVITKGEGQIDAWVREAAAKHGVQYKGYGIPSYRWEAARAKARAQGAMEGTPSYKKIMRTVPVMRDIDLYDSNPDLGGVLHFEGQGKSYHEGDFARTFKKGGKVLVMDESGAVTQRTKAAETERLAKAKAAAGQVPDAQGRVGRRPAAGQPTVALQKTLGEAHKREARYRRENTKTVQTSMGPLEVEEVQGGLSRREQGLSKEVGRRIFEEEAVDAKTKPYQAEPYEEGLSDEVLEIAEQWRNAPDRKLIRQWAAERNTNEQAGAESSMFQEALEAELARRLPHDKDLLKTVARLAKIPAKQALAELGLPADKPAKVWKKTGALLPVKELPEPPKPIVTPDIAAKAKAAVIPPTAATQKSAGQVTLMPPPTPTQSRRYQEQIAAKKAAKGQVTEPPKPSAMDALRLKVKDWGAQQLDHAMRNARTTEEFEVYRDALRNRSAPEQPQAKRTGATLVQRSKAIPQMSNDELKDYGSDLVKGIRKAKRTGDDQNVNILSRIFMRVKEALKGGEEGAIDLGALLRPFRRTQPGQEPLPDSVKKLRGARAAMENREPLSPKGLRGLSRRFAMNLQSSLADLYEAQRTVARNKGEKGEFGAVSRLGAFLGGEGGRAKNDLNTMKRVFSDIEKVGALQRFHGLVDLLALRHKYVGAVQRGTTELGKALGLDGKPRTPAEYKEAWDSFQQAIGLVKRIEGGKGLPMGITGSQSFNDIKQIMDSLTPAQRNAVLHGVQQFDQISTDTLARAVQVGAMSLDAAREWRARGPYATVTHFNTQIEALNAMRLSSPQSRVSGDAAKLLAELTGDTMINRDPIASTLRKFQLVNNELGGSEATRDVINMMKDEASPWKARVYRLKEGQRPGEGTLAVPFYDPAEPGVLQSWAVPEEFAKPLLGSARALDVVGPLSWMKTLHSIGRSGVVGVGALGFTTRNIWRDVTDAVNYIGGAQPGSYDPMQPFRYLARTRDWISGFREALNNGPIKERAYRNQELMGTWTASALPREMYDFAYVDLARRGQGPIEGISERIFDAGRRLYLKAIDIHDASEIATKLMVSKRLWEMGVDPTRIRDLVRKYGGSPDFAQHGEWFPEVNMLSMLVNAGIQGSKQTASFIKNNPRAASTLALYKVGWGLVMEKWNHQFTDEDGIPEIDKIDPTIRQRMNILMLPVTVDHSTGVRHVPLMWPKGNLERAITGPMAKALYNATHGEGTAAINTRDALGEIAGAFSPLQGGVDFTSLKNFVQGQAYAAMASLTPALRVSLETTGGFGSFSRTPIVPKRVQEVAPELQQTQYTSPSVAAASRNLTQVAHKFSRDVGVSPIWAEYFMRALHPAGAQATISTFDALGKMMQGLQPVEQDMISRARDIPLVGQVISSHVGFPKVDYRLKTLRERYYDVLDDAREKAKTLGVLARRSQSEDPESYYTPERYLTDPAVATAIGYGRAFTRISGDLAKIYRVREDLAQQMIYGKVKGEGTAKQLEPLSTIEVEEVRATMAKLYKTERELLESVNEVIPEQYKQHYVAPRRVPPPPR